MNEPFAWLVGAFVVALAAFSMQRSSSPPRPGTVPAMSHDDAIRRLIITAAAAALGPFGSDQHKAVAQGRGGKGYSNCGDLVHAVLWWAGCRSAHCNRDAPGRKWQSGNIAKIAALGKEAGGWTLFPSPADFRPGDVYLIGLYPDQLEHVGVVLSEAHGTTLRSADYGQVGQGGELRDRVYHRSGARWIADDDRILVARLDVSKVAFSAAPDVPEPMRSVGDVSAALADVEATQGNA